MIYVFAISREIAFRWIPQHLIDIWRYEKKMFQVKAWSRLSASHFLAPMVTLIGVVRRQRFKQADWKCYKQCNFTSEPIIFIVWILKSMKIYPYIYEILSRLQYMYKIFRVYNYTLTEYTRAIMAMKSYLFLNMASQTYQFCWFKWFPLLWLYGFKMYQSV